MTEKKLLTARLDINLIDRLRESAKAQDATMTDILEDLIEGYLDGRYTREDNNNIDSKEDDIEGRLEAIINDRLDSLIDEKIDGKVDEIKKR